MTMLPEFDSGVLQIEVDETELPVNLQTKGTSRTLDTSMLDSNILTKEGGVDMFWPHFAPSILSL
jgi:hypothetical protein